MAEKEQPKRWRCLTKDCNPFLNELTADLHKDETGHSVAKWPVRSTKGKAKAALRNATGYYGKYNVGAKSYAARRLGNA